MKKLNSHFVAFLLATSVVLSGTFIVTACNHNLDASGAYHGDKILFESDQTIANTYAVMDTFLAWERANEQQVPVTVHEAAERFRRDGPTWFQSATALRAAYIQNPDQATRTQLETVLATLRVALTEMTRYMIVNNKLPK